MLPATKSHTVPQLRIGSTVIHDSTSIMEEVVRTVPNATIVEPQTTRQRITCQILELMGDEWLLVPAFHFRWAYSGNGTLSQKMPMVENSSETNLLREHRKFNCAQWGHFLKPTSTEKEKETIGTFMIDNLMLNGYTSIKRCMRDLGVTDATVHAWESSCRNFLSKFDEHLTLIPYVLGSKPSTADFSLLGPIYAHLSRDPYPKHMMRKNYPNAFNWAKRLHDDGGGKPALRGRWMWNDSVPSTVLPLLRIFFKEMFPVLKRTCQVLTEYIKEEKPIKLPCGSFGPGSIDQEVPYGPLTCEFELPVDEDNVVKGRRMVIPYHVWLLQRLEETVIKMTKSGERKKMRGFLSSIDGLELLDLSKMLSGCRVKKIKGELFVDYDGISSRRNKYK